MTSESMSEVSVLREKPEMFEQRAELAADAISKQHYRVLIPLDVAHDSGMISPIVPI